MKAQEQRCETNYYIPNYTSFFHLIRNDGSSSESSDSEEEK